MPGLPQMCVYCELSGEMGMKTELSSHRNFKCLADTERGAQQPCSGKFPEDICCGQSQEPGVIMQVEGG